ncbi:hypothetical protein GCM10025859_02740 [Alicyclobacillus fastidiosus]|nr:hypothetical protein GCM10025859_02740 [Alicyclobacillus fastidiosus]
MKSLNGRVTPGYRTSVPNLKSDSRVERANSSVVTYYLSDSELMKYRELKPPAKSVSSYIPSKRTSVPGW